MNVDAEIASNLGPPAVCLTFLGQNSLGQNSTHLASRDIFNRFHHRFI